MEGSIASSVLTTVNNGGALTGTGTVGNLLVASGGILAPGPTGAPGTMTVAGDLTFQQGSSYFVQANSAMASSINVSGAASLAGTIYVAFAPGGVLIRSYDISACCGRTGEHDIQRIERRRAAELH